MLWSVIFIYLRLTLRATVLCCSIQADPLALLRHYRLPPFSESTVYQGDSLGTKDYMGIVVSKEALDYNAINTSINNSSQADYGAKLNEAISATAIKNVHYSNTANGSIYFKADATDKNKNSWLRCAD